MTIKTANICLLGITVLVFFIGATVYPFLPEQVVSHWDAAGEPNGLMFKFWGVFLLPIMMVGILLLYFIIPKIDPLKENIKEFRGHYNNFWVFVFVFFFYVFSLTLAWNLGYRFNFTITIIPAIATLLYVIGDVLEASKRNWFLGIRTPWTLLSDTVWKKTHILGGKLFKIAAAVSLLGVFFRDSLSIAAIIVLPIFIIMIISFVYSYVEFRKQPK